MTLQNMHRWVRPKPGMSWRVTNEERRREMTWCTADQEDVLAPKPWKQWMAAARGFPGVLTLQWTRTPSTWQGKLHGFCVPPKSRDPPL